jgi:integrase
MRVWTAEQMGAFLTHVEDDDLAGAWHLSALGMRRGEVLGLRWSDVDLEAGVVHVRQSRVQAGRDVHTGDPKTDRGRRDVPLHPAAIAALRQTRARTLSEPTVVPLRQAHGGERVVVVDESGEALRPDRYSDLFAEHVRAASLPAIRLHDMRHTAATVMLATGVPPVTVAGILGHSPDVLLRTYAHALPSAKRDAVNLLGGLYSSGT